MVKDKTRVVGKHTLESLTTGMYKDPFTIFREYIQNSSDAIDEAVKKNLIDSRFAEIRINVNPKKRTICIKDNGAGIPSTEAYKTLGDIGNSQKDGQETRGFRGIGRLAGFSCATSITFTSSAKGEDLKSIVSFNCDQMRRLLHDSEHSSQTAIEVLDSITFHDVKPEKSELHYFEVTLEGILEPFEMLLDEMRIKEYLVEVAPVPYDDQKFIYAGKIRAKFQEHKKRIEEYQIYFNNEKKPLAKPHVTHFKTGHQLKDKQRDDIRDIEFFEEIDSNGRLLFLGWYAKTSLFGTVEEKHLKGIRIRKGNIQIGDEQTFSHFFTQPRFNGWLIGEIYVYGKKLIPNSQRDDFEPNDAYNELVKKLRTYAKYLQDLIYRTSELNSTIKAVDEGEAELNRIKKEIDTNGITSETKREQLLKDKAVIEARIDKAHRDLVKLAEKVDDSSVKTKVENSLEKCGQLKDKIVKTENDIVDGDFSTKKDLPSSYSRDERKLYERIIKVLDENLDPEIASVIRKKILEELSRVNKRK